MTLSPAQRLRRKDRGKIAHGYEAAIVDFDPATDHGSATSENTRQPDAIRHMTLSPAQRLRLNERGKIAPGYTADIVVFDPDTVTARATYENPRQPAIGIEHVLINGTFALKNGMVTGARNGRVLRGNA